MIKDIIVIIGGVLFLGVTSYGIFLVIYFFRNNNPDSKDKTSEEEMMGL